MNYELITPEDIKNGWIYDTASDSYICLECGAAFEAEEIYRIDDRFFTCKKALELHISSEHSDRLSSIMKNETKYLSLTEKQSELLLLLAEGKSDNEIAELLKLSPSTIRHQKFVFREKIKSAKLLLGVWELMEAQADLEKSVKNQKTSDEYIQVHSGAKMIDDRYKITEEENEKILKSVFYSLSPLKLKVLSSKEKKKIVTLRRVVLEFDPSKTYNEKEINFVLKDIFSDYASLRRYLIEYGFMSRNADCSEYKVTAEPVQ